MIKIIILDIDGTLTDGLLYYSSSGEEIKSFNIKDGMIISAMNRLGYEFIVVTGKRSLMVERRMNELGISAVFQDISDKCEFIDSYIESKSYNYSDIAYIGDDLNDLKIMKKVGWNACPKDACAEVKLISDFVSELAGGHGAVREILEKLLDMNKERDLLINLFL